MKERVAFQTNVPVTVALAYPDGIQVEGRYGDQVMYTLADERVMYVPPVVRSRIVNWEWGKVISSRFARRNAAKALAGSSNGRLNGLIRMTPRHHRKAMARPR